MVIGILVSGKLGLTALLEINACYHISFVLTDNNSTDIVNFCKANNILYFAGNPRLCDVIEKLNYPKCDLLVSVNYLFLINEDLIALPKIMAINVHGSLLPKYRGRTPHIWAIINNEKTTGVTVHKIEKDCDSGDILMQVEIKIEEFETGNDLLKKFENIYPQLILDSIKIIQAKSFTLEKQNHKIATYFGKRIPSDGLIDWNWQKERIFNWVRAQAFPYPGAFCFIENNKIIINKIQIVNNGFDYSTLNGEIVALESSMPIIKTPNGCVKLTSFEYNATFKVGQLLK